MSTEERIIEYKILFVFIEHVKWNGEMGSEVCPSKFCVLSRKSATLIKSQMMNDINWHYTELTV